VLKLGHEPGEKAIAVANRAAVHVVAQVRRDPDEARQRAPREVGAELRERDDASAPENEQQEREHAAAHRARSVCLGP
jgi:hypothetical protein